MPVDRVTLKEANGLKGIASVDGDQAGVMLYNRTYKARDYVLALDKLPFDTCDVTVYPLPALRGVERQGALLRRGGGIGGGHG